MTSLPVDSKMLPCLASHENPTQGHLGTHHIVITVEREKKRKGSGREAENKKSTEAENNCRYA